MYRAALAASKNRSRATRIRVTSASVINPARTSGSRRSGSTMASLWSWRFPRNWWVSFELDAACAMGDTFYVGGENGGRMTTVLLQTTMGDVKIELLDKTMPITAGNFRKLVAERFYDGTIFHRVIPNFMIQGGDPEGTGMGGPGYSIKDELPADNRNARGTISMANAGPNTGGSQFFINVVDNHRLDRKHPVFGRVVAGMEIVDAISRTPTDDEDRPRTKVTIRKASVLS